MATATGTRKKKVDLTTAVSLSAMGFKPYTPKKNEEYMNGDQLAHFHAILDYLKKELMNQADATMQHMQDDSDNLPDPNDRATKEEEVSLELRTRDRERKLIKKIEQALEKVNSQDYGYCDTCGEEIGIRRLEARPTANMCIECKTLDEIKEKQQQG